MLSLRLPENIQDRVFDYYYEMSDSQYISNSLTNTVNYYQTRIGIKKLKFLNSRTENQIDAL